MPRNILNRNALWMIDADERANTIVAELFIKLLALTDDEVLCVLTFAMAEMLQSGTCVVERTSCDLAVDMTASYVPDNAFFDLPRSKAAVNAMVTEIGGKRVADGNVSATTKMQKGIIRDFLAGENGRTRKENGRRRRAAHRESANGETKQLLPSCDDRGRKDAALSNHHGSAAIWPFMRLPSSFERIERLKSPVRKPTRLPARPSGRALN